MTQERFQRLVDNPDLLTTITYEELKTLALAYPYAHNLRYLQALKAQQTGHAEQGKALATAAAYSLDRSHLFGQTGARKWKKQAGALLGAEEILELRPLSAPKPVLEMLPAVDASNEQEDKHFAIDATPDAPPVAPQSPTSSTAIGAATEQAPEQEDQIKPFAEWVQGFNLPPLPERKVKVMAPPPAPLPPAPPTAQQLAALSVAENAAVASETLANLYAQQGHVQKAIAMYEKLRLAMPEKSAYFAALIQDLQK